MTKNLVSIIVPVYNAKPYLERCIDSIQKQLYDNIEIILVDDGSEDGSGDICDAYKKKDARIKVIHKENGGNTSARRMGMRCAKGEYSVFVDADDYIGLSYVSDMVTAIKDADIVCANVKKVFPYGEISIKSKIHAGTYLYNDENIITNMFYYKETNEFGVLPYLCAKLYKTDFIAKGMQTIDDRIQYAEDRILMFWSMMNAQKIVFIESEQYHYLIHEESLCTSTDEQFLTKLTCFFSCTKKLFEQHEKKEHLLRQLDRYMVDSVIYGLNRKIGLSQSNLVPRYYCQIDKLPEGSRIVLYGAGNVGRDFYKQFQRMQERKIVLWVDTNDRKYREEGLDVMPVDAIENGSFDYILIAVLHENVVQNIKVNLKKHKIDEKKLCWIEPQKIF